MRSGPLTLRAIEVALKVAVPDPTQSGGKRLFRGESDAKDGQLSDAE
jgi:hypothetical protein